MSTIRKPKYIALLICVAIFSFVLGSTTTRSTYAADNLFTNIRLLSGVLSLVNDNYVEKVDASKLIYSAIDGMLQALDPHSNFLSKESFTDMGERFSGKFYGIGIEFDVLDGYLYVISVIDGSPSEAVGLQSGDRLVKINGASAIGIKHDEVRKKLRGEKGTTVEVTVNRVGAEEPFNVTITRDRIPIRSVLSSFMLDEQTGYIQMVRFAKTTSDELETALNKLENVGMKRLIFDLRGNSGGYLDQAVEVSSKFIEEGKMIVETRGRTRSSNQEFRSGGSIHGQFPLVVLLDHRSASASEIVAGAVQDWDRGVIAGSRSFGKGLVQTLFAEPHLRDGSALKLTTAQYYTPSGRLIQRDYKNKSYQEYVEEAFEDSDEVVGQEMIDENEDGIDDRPVFNTANGRTVYGGGGITPDVSIKAPKRKYPFVIGKFHGWTPFDRACFEFATQYGVNHQNLKDDFENFFGDFEVSDEMVEAFKKQISDSGISFSQEEFDTDLDVVKLQLKRSVARNMWGDEEAGKVGASGDVQLQKALLLFNTHEILVENK